jgi:hypothetical protein
MSKQFVLHCTQCRKHQYTDETDRERSEMESLPTGWTEITIASRPGSLPSVQYRQERVQLCSNKCIRAYLVGLVERVVE